MSPDCDERNGALADWAAGADPAPGLAEHVERCERCKDRLDAMRRRLGAMDEALADWMRHDTPGEEFVRATAEAAARTRRGVPALPWVAAAAVLVLALAGFLSLRGSTDDAVPWDAAIEITSWRSPTDALMTGAQRTVATTPTFGDFYYTLDTPTENRR